MCNMDAARPTFSSRWPTSSLRYSMSLYISSSIWSARRVGQSRIGLRKHGLILLTRYDSASCRGHAPPGIREQIRPASPILDATEN